MRTAGWCTRLPCPITPRKKSVEVYGLDESAPRGAASVLPFLEDPLSYPCGPLEERIGSVTLANVAIIALQEKLRLAKTDFIQNDTG